MAFFVFRAQMIQIAIHQKRLMDTGMDLTKPFFFSPALFPSVIQVEVISAPCCIT